MNELFLIMSQLPRTHISIVRTGGLVSQLRADRQTRYRRSLYSRLADTVVRRRGHPHSRLLRLFYEQSRRSPRGGRAPASYVVQQRRSPDPQLRRRKKAHPPKRRAAHRARKKVGTRTLFPSFAPLRRQPFLIFRQVRSLVRVYFLLFVVLLPTSPSHSPAAVCLGRRNSQQQCTRR